MKWLPRISRSLTALTAASLMATASASQESASYNFRVLLDEKPIGYHEFELNHEDAGKRVSSTAKFDVKLLFITAFKYRHSSSERWQDNCLTGIEAQTNSNGKRQNVNGQRVDDTLRIDSSSGTRQVEGCVQTFAYWNPSILKATQLLNSQTGDYVDVEVTSLGSDRVKLGDTKVDARKFKLKSAPDYEGKPVDITLWYDPSVEQWLALESAAKGDRMLRYERINPPTASDPSLDNANTSASR